MKTNLIIFFLFLFVAAEYTNAQINPITVSDHPHRSNYTIYETSNYDQYSQMVKNQSTALKDKLFSSQTKVKLEEDN